MKPFEEPIYVTRPLPPDFDFYTERLKEVWESKWLSNGELQRQIIQYELRNFSDVRGVMKLYPNYWVLKLLKVHLPYYLKRSTRYVRLQNFV